MGTRWGGAGRDRARRLSEMASSRHELAVDYLDRRLRETFEKAPIGEALVGIGGYFLEVNRAFCRMLGYAEAELCTLRFEDVLDADDSDGRRRLLEALRGRRADDPIELLCYRKNGSHVYVECFISPISDDAGEPAYVIVQVQDLSPNRDRDRLAALVEHSPDVLAVVSPDGILLYASAAYRAMFGVDPADAVGRRVGSRTHPDDVEDLYKTLALIAEQPDALATFELRVADAEGRWRRIEVTAANWVADPAVGGIICNGRDVTPRVSSRPPADVTHDPLTGLPGRRMAVQRVESALARAVEGSCLCALILIDIDHFSAITDHHGTDAGDVVLSTFARRLVTWLRPADMLARFDDDVFAVVAEGLPSADVVTELMRRLIQATSSPVATGAGLLRVRASIGGAVGVGEESGSLIANAHAALTEAKRAGRERGVLWTPAD